MLRIRGKIPITISPFFWITAAFIGYLGSSRVQGGNLILLIAIWVAIIFVSILVHEFGHALMARLFGQSPRIELVAFGGLTYPEGKRIKKWQEFLVVLNGPLFGLCLFLLATLLLYTNWIRSPLLLYSLSILQGINLFWTMINLLPVLPLDGGQLLRILCESIFKVKGIKYAHLASLSLSAVIGLIFFFIGFFLVGAVFVLFAFQNFESWRQMRYISEVDQNEDLTMELKEIEELLLKEQKEEAIPRLEAMRKRAKKGVMFTLSSQYLANFKAKENRYREVYQLLLPIKNHLTPESQIQLHSAAYELSDYPLVAELANSCFRNLPDPLIALHNAEAYAALKQVTPAIGWLKAAKKNGIENLEEVIERPAFHAIRHDAVFEAFVRSFAA